MIAHYSLSTKIQRVVIDSSLQIDKPDDGITLSKFFPGYDIFSRLTKCFERVIFFSKTSDNGRFIPLYPEEA